MTTPQAHAIAAGCGYPHGIAIALAGVPATSKFHEGSQTFRLYPSLNMMEDDPTHVTVGFSPQAEDHGQCETTVFKTDQAGQLADGWGESELLPRSARVVGRLDVAQALSNLRYVQVDAELFDELQTAGYQAALDWCKTGHGKKLRLTDPADYAQNNWGIFAARIAVDRGTATLLGVETNTIDWAAIDRQQAKDYAEEAQDFQPIFF